MVRQAAPSLPPSEPAEPETASGEVREASRRGWLGVELKQRAAEEPGVLVRDVVRGSPAAARGVASGDAIVSIDGQNVSRPDEVVALVAQHEPRQSLSVGLLRAGEIRLIAVELASFPNAESMMGMQYTGTPAPNFEALEAAHGSVPVELHALRGKVLVLEFGASWCPACRLLNPVLSAWHDRLSPQGVVVLGIAAEPVSVVTSSALQLGLSYPALADPSGATTKAYRAFALPTVFVIDKRGDVRDVMVGYSGEHLARLEKLIKTLIDG